jgi:hypothetical protein
MTVIMPNEHNEEESHMKGKFVRQKSNGAAPDVEIDFGAAAEKVATRFEPGEYTLRIESARVVGKNQNVLIALDLTETESGDRVDNRPIWVSGPNADAGNLAAENQHLIAQLLTLAKLPTVGNVGTLIPKLAGLEFGARLVIDNDSRGHSFNSITDVAIVDVAIAGIYQGDDASS